MNLTFSMVRKRVIEVEDADDARIDALRKELREKRGPDTLPPRPSFLSRFRRRRTLVIP